MSNKKYLRKEPWVSLENVKVEFPFHKTATRTMRDASQDLKLNVDRMETGSGARFVKKGRKYLAAAIDDISLDLRSGDRMGLMGHNGAGKSTLIKVISGLLQPSSGRVVTVGHVASTISTTFGFDMALSGRENILRRGLLMRMSVAEIKIQTEDILDFAELGNYVDMPMGTYSAGMKARLGFAITTAAKADILVMDEWIGAGDPRFIEKCETRLSEMVGRSRILILATHKEKLLKRVCNRFAIMEKGGLTEVDMDIDGFKQDVPETTKEAELEALLRARAENYKDAAIKRGERLEIMHNRTEALKEKLSERTEQLKAKQNRLMEKSAQLREKSDEVRDLRQKLREQARSG